MKKPFIIALVVLTTAGSGRVVAAEGRTNHFQQLTLEQALELAEQSSPLLAEAKARIDAAAGRATQSGAFPNPEAIARMESAPIRGNTTGEAEYLAGISQTVPLGGRLGKARQAEQFERESAVKQLELTRREVRQRVHGAFATTLYQEHASRLQSRIADDMAKAVAITDARLKAGDVVLEDLARVEMDLARTKVELKRAESLRNQAMGALRTAIGDPALSVESVAGNLDTTFEIPTIEALAATLAKHPAATAADASVRAQDTRIAMAKGERIPDVKVEVLYHRLEAEQRNTFDVGLSIPLPIFDRNKGRIREARAELAAAEARSRATKNELNQRLLESHARLTTALADNRSFKEEILPRAETILKATEARYSAGDISLTEALTVRRDWISLQFAYIESVRRVMEGWASLKTFVSP